MRCPACGWDNPPAARFCAECGSGLARTCPQCGDAVSGGGRFCTSCGEALTAGATSGPARETPPPPERRRVSVLFADLENFTAIAEQLDPEEVRTIQARYFELARSVVATYGGTIEKFIGDAVMAVWGAPTAHEDDPERAVRAALSIVDGIGRLGVAPPRRALRARAAVTTGEAAVTVGAVGQGMVAGDLVNGAARLQAEAPAGGVLVDESTRRLAEDAATFEPVGALQVKGRREPIIAHAAMPLTRTWPGGRRGSHAGPFVGRDRELRELVGLFDRTVEERRSRLVAVTGIAGIGKSRLAWELGETLEARPELIAWHAGRAPAYGDEITFAPLADMVRARLHLVEGPDRELTERQLHATLTEFVADEDERRWLVQRLEVLVAGASAAPFERAELFAAWRRFFERVSDAAPTVLVFEDLQWADPALLEFIEHLAGWTRDHPILIVALARPELLDRRPDWGATLGSFTRIHLERLGDEPMRALLSGLAPTLPAETVGRILEHAGGVPLYAVEVARILSDGTSDEGPSVDRRRTARPPLPGHQAAIEVPDSLHGLLAARIDALMPRERQLLLAASVLGRRFTLPALTAVAGSDAGAVLDRLQGLVRREMLTVDEDSRTPGTGEVSFVQDLVREVAYQRLSLDERRTLHLAAARFLESQPDDDQVEALAGHLSIAHSLAPDHPDARRLARRAVGALRRAAHEAMRLHLADRAVGLTEQALRMIEPSARVPVLEEAATAARAADRLELAERHLREIAHIHQEAGRRGDAAAARAQLASVMLMAQRNEPAIAELELALRAHRRVLSDPVAAELAAQLARARMIVGDDAGALAWAERALEAAKRHHLDALATELLVTRGTARWRLGDVAGGMADLHAAIAEAQMADRIGTELRARNNLAWMVVADDPRLSLDTAREAVGLASAMGMGDMAVQLGTLACAVAVDVGEWEWALETAKSLGQRPITEAHRIDLASVTAVVLALRGEPTPTDDLDALMGTVSNLDPQLGGAVELSRAWHRFVGGDFAQAHELATIASASALATDRISCLALAGRAALWAGLVDEAAAALDAMRAVRVEGRATRAAIDTLEAGIGAVSGVPDSAERYAAATESWRELDLPLSLGLCLLDAGRLTASERARHEAAEVLGGLGAVGLLALVHKETVPPTAD